MKNKYLYIVSGPLTTYLEYIMAIPFILGFAASAAGLSFLGLKLKRVVEGVLQINRDYEMRSEAFLAMHQARTRA